MQKDDDYFETEKQKKYFKTIFMVLIVGLVSIFRQVNLIFFNPASEMPSTFQSKEALAIVSPVLNKRKSIPKVSTEANKSAKVTTPEDASRIGSTPDTMMIHSQSLNKEECRRKCHPQDKHYNIIILDHYEAAGLGDRLYVFRRLALLAGYLCARLYVPPPYTMVSLRLLLLTSTLKETSIENAYLILIFVLLSPKKTAVAFSQR